MGSSAPDFLAWYERWLDHMVAGLDNRALGHRPTVGRNTAVAGRPFGT
ncbi:hypothetical protein ACWD00_25435 [Streptomyces viridiviolaceus]